MLNTQIQLLPLTAAPETAQYDRYTYTTFELQWPGCLHEINSDANAKQMTHNNTLPVGHFNICSQNMMCDW